MNESTLSSVSKFLKAQYNNIFKEPNQNLNNLFVTFTKKVDTDRNISNLYQRYIKANQTSVQNEINNAESIDAVNKIITDEVKYFYYSLKPIVNKLQNDEFSMESIFSRSKDKRLQVLMSYPEDQFANAVPEYTGQIVVPQIKDLSGLNKETTTEETVAPEATTERIKYNIQRILEAEENTEQEDLVSYKKAAINWINTTLFDLLKPKMQLLNQIGANTSNAVDQISDEMKGSGNENAKKMIINKIMNMNDNELENLAKTLGLSEEETGKL
jgi:hypothetical protein